MKRIGLRLTLGTLAVIPVASCVSLGLTAPVVVRNERHQAVTMEIRGQQPFVLADCTDVLLSLPANGDWMVVADGLVVYDAADWRAGRPRDGTYAEVTLQGGVEPVIVSEKPGVAEAAGVNPACRG